MYSPEFLNGLCQNPYYFNEFPCIYSENQRLQGMYACMQSYIVRNQQLQREAIQLKATIASLINQNQIQKIALREEKTNKQGQTSNRKFRKNHACPKEGCGRKYSSRISLNRHLRQKKHRIY